jgi:sulfite reductase (NADPH) flavoprotein alpha-component
MTLIRLSDLNYLLAAILVVVYALFCWLCWYRYRQRQNSAAQLAAAVESETILVGFASQTGSAFVLAQKTLDQLVQAGQTARLLPLNQITPDLLQQVSRFLVVASTYGEGEAPDDGNRFIARRLAKIDKQGLSHLQVLILGLGDSSYQHFCGFAHQLHRELHARGAHFIADVIEVDRMDDSAIRRWQYYLGQISGHAHFSDWSKPAYEQWKIISRQCINPGSQGAPAFHLQLTPAHYEICSGLWQAGDVVEIGPFNSAELPHREYSIASVPQQGSLDLLVRQVRDENNKLGLGSGWLTEHAQLAQPINLRIRANAHFHAPANQCPLILIGNGTGIAGLRSHIANPQREGARQWLFFGERSAGIDDFFHSDIQVWLNNGRLERADRVFSRDARPGEPRYVQDLLPLHAQEIRQWAEEGAAIFVCGSLQGMAQAVDDQLRAILGAEQLELMADQRRYCRDVY